jgi:hypothetical protein
VTLSTGDDRNFELYGQRVRKRYKTLKSTWKPAGGRVRAVLVAEPTGWVALRCTDVAASVAAILATVANCSALETAFRNFKEVVGAASIRFGSCGRASERPISASGASR